MAAWASVERLEPSIEGLGRGRDVSAGLRGEGGRPLALHT